MNKDLTDQQKAILFNKETEAPFTGKYLQEKRTGMFSCVNCGATLFSSDAKFDSKTGWPSFSEALPGAIEYRKDTSHGMVRIEAVCASCHGHLGHVFDDGPEGSGKRYCINSACLDFNSAE